MQTRGKYMAAENRKKCSANGRNVTQWMSKSKCIAPWVVKCARKLMLTHANVAELFASGVNSGMRTLKLDQMDKVLMRLIDIKMVRSVFVK